MYMCICMNMYIIEAYKYLLYLLLGVPWKGILQTFLQFTSQTPGLRLLFVPALGIAGGKICSKDLE